MHRARVLVAAALSAAVVGSVPCVVLAGDESVDLRPRHVPGDSAYVEFRQDVDSTVSGSMIPSGTMKSKASQVIGATQLIEKPAAGEKVARLKFTWDRVALSVDSQMQSIHFDSDKADEAGPATMMAMFFRPMLGQSLTLDMDDAGQVTKVGGLDAVRKHVQQAAGNPMLYQQMSSSLDDETNRQMWGATRYVLYPNKQVKVGDTWSRGMQQKGRNALLNYEYKCKLSAIRPDQGRQVAIVTYDGTVKKDDKNPQSQPTGPQVESLTGTFTGTAVYDVERGAMVKQTQDVTMTAESTMAQPGAAPGKLTSSQTIHQTYTLMTPQQRQAEKAKAAAAAATAPSATAPAAASAPARGRPTLLPRIQPPATQPTNPAASKPAAGH